MTTLELDAPSSGGPPAIKFDKPGAYVVCGIVDVKEYQQRDLATGDLLTWDDGKPKMGKMVTALVVSADGAYTGRDDDQDPAAVGDVVTFWCEKGKHYTWRDAVKAHGKVLVGDVMKWERLADEPPKKAGFNAQKVYRAALRSPEARDGDIVDRCAAARIAQANRPAVDEPQPGYSADPF
jgi:hypothetical protein